MIRNSELKSNQHWLVSQSSQAAQSHAVSDTKESRYTNTEGTDEGLITVVSRLEGSFGSNTNVFGLVL